MTDTIEQRLRRPVSMLSIEEGTALLNEAAAEIERLRGAYQPCLESIDRLAAQLQDCRTINDALSRRAATAERLRSEAWEKAAGIADLYANNPVKCLAYSRADYENGACDNAIAIAAAIRASGPRGGGG